MAGKLKPKGYLRPEAPYVTKATKTPSAPKPKPTKATGTRTVSRGR
jgi:hypothetical protein